MRSHAAAASLVVIAVACTGSQSAAPDAALARDLQLASMATLTLAPTPTNALMSLETLPTAAPTPRPRAARSGPRRVQSEQPTARAAATEAPAAVGEADYEVELAGNEGVAVATDIVDDGVALPRPVPVSVGLPTVGSGDGVYTRGGGGGIGRVVIRGGDIDDCKIHDQRGRRPVYRPGSSGVGTSRWPVTSRAPARGEASNRPRATGRSGSWPVARRN